MTVSMRENADGITVLLYIRSAAARRTGHAGIAALKTIRAGRPATDLPARAGEYIGAGGLMTTDLRPRYIVGMMKALPLSMFSGQRCITDFCLV